MGDKLCQYTSPKVKVVWLERNVLSVPVSVLTPVILGYKVFAKPTNIAILDTQTRVPIY
jgi:hypothetical protein